MEYEYRINLNASTYLTAVDITQAELLKKIRNDGFIDYYNDMFRGNMLT